MIRIRSRQLFRLARFRRYASSSSSSASSSFAATGSGGSPRWSVNSPKDVRPRLFQEDCEKATQADAQLYDHLSQYIVGQERAKRILSVAVFNHYHRITPPSLPSPTYESGDGEGPQGGSSMEEGLFSQFADPQSPSPSAPSSFPSSSSAYASPPPGSTTTPPLPGLPRSGDSVDDAPARAPRLSPAPASADLDGAWDPSRAGASLDDGTRRDITRVTGLDGQGDPSLTHAHEMLTNRSREGQWARDGYFSSSPPSLLPNRRRRLVYPGTLSSAALGPPRNSGEGGKGKRRASPEEELRAQKEELEAGLGDGGPWALGRAASRPGQGAMGEVVIEKSNVLMVGPTGTGKTLMARTLAKILDVPFASCDATSYTQAGYVGEDVENCVLRLLQAAEYDVARTEIGIIHIDEVDKLARRGGGDFGTWGGGRDVGGEGVQQALLRLLEGTTLTLNAKPPAISSTSPAGGSSGPGGLGGASGGASGGAGTRAEKASGEARDGRDGREGREGRDREAMRDAMDPPGWDPNNPMNRGFAAGKKGVREGLPGFGGGGGGSSGKGETFVVDTTNILFVLSGAFVGLESIVNRRLGKGSIGFGAPLPLPPVTSSTTAEISPTPLKGLSTPDLQTYGLIPEFLGRLPILSTLHPLSIDDLVRILVEPKNALLKQYQAMFDRYGSELRFTRKAIAAIAKEGLDRGGGARGLRGVLEEVLVDSMFEVPGSSVRYCLITSPVVQHREPALYFSRGQRMAFLNAIEEEDGPRVPTPLAEEQSTATAAEEEEVEEERMAARG